MLRLFAVLLGTSLLGGAVVAGPLDYQLTQTGTSGSYMYFWTGGPFPAGTELDIRFDPAVFQSISNPSTHTGFDVQLFQPNTPTGTVGILSLLSEVDNSILDSAVTVQFVLLSGQTAGPQAFFVNEYDELTGEFIRVLNSGTSTPLDTTAIPEPTAFVLSGLGLCLVCTAARRREARR